MVPYRAKHHLLSILSILARRIIFGSTHHSTTILHCFQLDIFFSIQEDFLSEDALLVQYFNSFLTLQVSQQSRCFNPLAAEEVRGVLHIHRYPLGNLALYFLGENLNKFDKLYIFPYIYVMMKDHQKPHVGTLYKGNLVSLFSSIHCL